MAAIPAKKAGVSIPPPRRGSSSSVPPEIAKQVVEAYRSGIPYAEVGARYGISRSTAQRITARAGVESRPHGLHAPSINVPIDLAKLGYFAGLFDGEGNMQMRKKGQKSVGCKISVYSTTLEVMDWLEATIGGNVRWDTKRTERHGWKPIGIWEVYRAQDVALLLRATLPYLIIKRSAAQIALAYLDSVLKI